MYDAHVHSTFSPDGKSAIDEYIALVDQGKLKGIGFAEHLDFLPECGAYGFLDYDSYKSTIEKYQKAGYQVYAGAEIDYAYRVEKTILERLKNEKYDFTICSIHMVNGISVSDRNIDHFYHKENFYDMVKKYYDELSQSIRVSQFDAIAHIGVFRRYLAESFFEGYGIVKWLDELDDETAKLCAQSDKIVEVNSSGLFAVSASTAPRRSFLQRYFEYGGRKVCMSSDAHQAAHAGRGLGIVKEMLTEIGYKYIYLPWDKENPVRLK